MLMQLGRFKDVKFGVKRYFEALNLQGKTVVDAPAGKGKMVAFLRDHGAEVKALDLFTHGTVINDVKIVKADLTEDIPIDNNSVDFVLCQEGIEHLPNQFACLKEFSRVLKDDGVLIITTPSSSNLRARFFAFFTEGYKLRHLPANEFDDVLFGENDNIAFGHLFLVGIQKLRVLAKASGFKIKRVHPTKLSGTSLILFPLLYPIVVFFNVVAYYRSFNKRKESSQVSKEIKQNVYQEILRVNLNPYVLLCNHLFVEFKKCPIEKYRFINEGKG